MRRGFTLVEVLVALILFQVAMLAFAGTTAVAARDLATAHRNSRAQVLARNRLELLRARACPMPATDSARVAGGFTEHWTIQATETLRHLSVVVEYSLSRGRAGRVALESAMLCS